MTTVTIKIPEGKKLDLSNYVKDIGGEIITKKSKTNKDEEEYDEDNEVTHNVFFGENIKRAIKAFKR